MVISLLASGIQVGHYFMLLAFRELDGKLLQVKVKIDYLLKKQIIFLHYTLLSALYLINAQYKWKSVIIRNVCFNLSTHKKVGFE